MIESMANALTFSSASYSPLLIRSMAAQQKPIPSVTKTVGSKKEERRDIAMSQSLGGFKQRRAIELHSGSTTYFPLGEPGPRVSSSTSKQPVKLLTRVEQLRLLTKAEKAGLLSAAENFGLSLSTIEKLGLLSKAEEFGVLSAATDPGTPSTLLNLSLALLILGPAFVYLVPEDYPWEIALQVVIALLSVVGGSGALAASNLVSNLQKLS